MAGKHLGEVFDIHGGGIDLVFPHHENEIAQSEGAFGHTSVNYWVHNGFVRLDNEKMSKSLGNFFTIREVLKKFDAEVIRFFILRAHYRSPLNYSDVHLDDGTKLVVHPVADKALPNWTIETVDAPRRVFDTKKVRTLATVVGFGTEEATRKVSLIANGKPVKVSGCLAWDYQVSMCEVVVCQSEAESRTMILFSKRWLRRVWKRSCGFPEVSILVASLDESAARTEL